MEENKKYSTHKILDKPILGCILLTVWGFLFYQIFGMGFGSLMRAIFCTDAALYMTAAVGGIIVLLAHRLWFRKEFKGYFAHAAGKKRDLWIIVLIWIVFEAILMSTDYMADGVRTPTITLIATALMAGIAEEAVYRALSVSILMRKFKDEGSLLVVVFLPAALFAFTHLNNLGTTPASDVIPEVIFAFGAGCFFGAIYLRTGNILLPMAIHAVYDLFVFLERASSAEETGSVFSNVVLPILIQVGVCAVAVVLALLLLKGHEEEIRTLWRGIWPAEAQGADSEEQARKIAKKRVLITIGVIAAVILILVLLGVVLGAMGTKINISVS